MSKWDWVKYYDVDLINTIVAKVETKIESITLYSNDTFVIWINLVWKNMKLIHPNYSRGQGCSKKILFANFGLIELKLCQFA